MDFEDIRPYKDSEVPEKLSALVEEPQFQQVISQVNPKVPFERMKAGMLRIKSIGDFQRHIIVPLLEQLIEKSTKGLSGRGLENLDSMQTYLFVSTHRDIALDSALMDYILLKNGMDTVEIAIGDNLMKIPWVVDLVKLNKTFIVKRSLPKEQKAQGSMQLSSYIFHALKEKHESIWIAQKAGRSKDGNDRTNPSLLRMFTLAKPADQSLIDYVKNLNICPVSIAYEYNPCDVLTLPELMAQANGEKYEKAPMEDLMQMAEGITGDKGRVCVSFGKPINNALDSIDSSLNLNEINNKIAALIDREIHATYALMPSNYIAADLLQQSHKYSSEYTPEEKQHFEDYMTNRLVKVDGEPAFVKEVFLKMYANPVWNREGVV